MTNVLFKSRDKISNLNNTLEKLLILGDIGMYIDIIKELNNEKGMNECPFGFESIKHNIKQMVHLTVRMQHFTTVIV